MDKAIQNCFDICPSSKCLGTGAVQSRADFNIRTEEVGITSTLYQKIGHYGSFPASTSNHCRADVSLNFPDIF